MLTGRCALPDPCDASAGDGGFLLLASGDGVVGAPLPGADAAGAAVLPPLPEEAVADAVDFDSERQRLVWADLDAGKLFSIGRDGSNLTTLVSDLGPSHGPTGLAVDWVTG